jgi:hypothetical protein
MRLHAHEQPSCPGRGAAFSRQLKSIAASGRADCQFAAKQYKRPAPPVLIKSFWLQPPSGPREGCAAFQELIVGEGVPVRSE